MNRMCSRARAWFNWNDSIRTELHSMMERQTEKWNGKKRLLWKKATIKIRGIVCILLHLCKWRSSETFEILCFRIEECLAFWCIGSLSYCILALCRHSFPVPCALSAFWLLFAAFVHDRVCIFIVGGLTAATIWKIQRNLLLFAQRQLESNSTPVQRQMTWWLPHSVIQCNATNSQLKAGLMSMHLQLAHTYTRGAYTRFT